MTKQIDPDCVRTTGMVAPRLCLLLREIDADALFAEMKDDGMFPDVAISRALAPAG